jgi:hypothetical protein
MFKKLKYQIYISIQTLYSVLIWSTFGSDYSLESSWVWRYKLGTPVFVEFLPFFSADPLNLCQVGWGVSVHSYFQVSPEVFWSGSSPGCAWSEDAAMDVVWATLRGLTRLNVLLTLVTEKESPQSSVAGRIVGSVLFSKRSRRRCLVCPEARHRCPRRDWFSFCSPWLSVDLATCVSCLSWIATPVCLYTDVYPVIALRRE